MEQQIVNAVAAALSPDSSSELRAQAMQFCQQVKDSPSAWEPCLSLFLRTDPQKESAQARLFALQTIEEALAKRTGELDQSALIYMRDGFMAYIKKEFVVGTGEAEAIFLRNRVARTYALLFKASYMTVWPTFFADLFDLILTGKPSDGSRLDESKSIVSDVVLRILHEITIDVSDMNLQRSREEQAQSNLIKDAIRSRDMQKSIEFMIHLATEWAGLLRLSGDPARSDQVTTSENLLEKSIRVIGEWAPWVEISLIVTKSFITLLYSTLRLPDFRLKLAATVTLIEIVSKGMQPRERLQMYDALNILGMLSTLDLGVPDDSAHVSEDEQHFREQVARLVNAFGLELTKVIDESSNSPELKDRSYDLIVETFPYILRFVADVFDDTASAVFPYVRELLSIYKQMRKKMPRAALPKQKTEFLSSLLACVLKKLEYDEDFDWVEDDNSDEGAMFGEIREALKIIYDAISSIDEVLFASTVQSCVISSLQKFKVDASSVSWQQVEGLLYTMYLYGDTFKGNPSFTTTPYPIPRKPGNAAIEQPDPATLQLSTLGQMMEHLIQSEISNYPHPAVQLQFFEVIVRYSFFFEVREVYLVEALKQFIDHRGLHNVNDRVRIRVWYLFYRFVSKHRARMMPYVDQIFNAMGDILVIVADLSERAVDDIDPNDIGSYVDTKFEAQLYLFETVGNLLSLEGMPAMKQNEYLQAVLGPITAGIRQRTEAEHPAGDIMTVMSIHHLSAAIGSVAKGLPDAPRGSSRVLPLAFQHALESVLTALKHKPQRGVIREATRATFTRLIATYDISISTLLSQLVPRLLEDIHLLEMIDFCPFMALIIHRYRLQSIEAMDIIFSAVIDTIFVLMGRQPGGTDESLQLASLKKAYLALLSQVFTCEIGKLLLTGRSKGRLDNIIGSILHLVNEYSDPSIQKQAFGLLHKMVAAWGGEGAGSVDPSSKRIDQGGPLEGFDHFIRERIVPLCFEVPVYAAFDLKDAQSQLVLGEIASLQKTILQMQKGVYLDYLRAVYLPRINCPINVIEDFIRSLEVLDAKMFRKHFQSFVQQSRGG